VPPLLYPKMFNEFAEDNVAQLLKAVYVQDSFFPNILRIDPPFVSEFPPYDQEPVTNVLSFSVDFEMKLKSIYVSVISKCLIFTAS
jgi:hypothetical protein